MSLHNLPVSFSPLGELLGVDSPSGDEYRMAEFLTAIIEREVPSATIVPLGPSLLAVRGSSPAVAIVSHLDTTGFTAGYNAELIPIGSPDPEQSDLLRTLGGSSGTLRIDIDKRRWTVDDASAAPPGERLVFDAGPTLDGSILSSPYLDNRAGLWAGLEVLRRQSNIVVAFTSGEEVSGHGARVCARHLYESYGITKALISDITWDTEDVHLGAGPAISLRDRSIPSRRFIDQVLAIAAGSGIPYQIEIESDGGSDGSHMDRGSYPIEWLFIGAPEKFPHSSHEQIDLDDLAGMANLLTIAAEQLSA